MAEVELSWWYVFETFDVTTVKLYILKTFRVFASKRKEMTTETPRHLYLAQAFLII